MRKAAAGFGGSLQRLKKNSKGGARYGAEEGDCQKGNSQKDDRQKEEVVDP